METSLRVSNPWTGSPVYVRERTQSTMDDARQLALLGCVEGTVVVAGFQRKGRGRAPGRSWQSRPWESLMATIVIDRERLPFPVAEMPHRAALAAAQAVKDLGINPSLKLPNDLMVDGRKLAGILCETCNQCVLVGIGVNCLQAAFPEDLQDRACSILQLTGREVNPLVLLPLVLHRLKEAVTTAA
jgi:BirA family biotin operon repressor/biotin-[acetyl-CoA-carboxylase] ligase